MARMNLSGRGFVLRAIYHHSNPMCSRLNQRYVSTRSKLFQISEEVEEALHTGKPVVALESTIYTHGFPYPENVALASHLESLVRTHGGVPATIGIVDGKAHVGLNAEMLIQLVSTAGSKDTWKISRRDLGFIGGLGLRGTKLNGGTTIAGTMILAHLAGIKVFATGGLGGVHRGGENSMDISADLTELGRTPVAVVSSGCKSFLDIPRTLEYLETQGVGVGTFADGREGAVDFPAFFSRDSGVKSPRVIRDEAEAAAIIHAQFQLSIHSGLLFANPVPSESGLVREEVEIVIEQAVREAEEQGVGGAANTPFILNRIKELTNGGTIGANRALIEANVIRGTKVAVELAKLEQADREGTWSGTRNASNPKVIFPIENPISDATVREAGEDVASSATQQVDLLVIGSLACDTKCDYKPFHPPTTEESPILHTSNPATISQSSGGVGRNVAVAAQYAGANVGLASVIADDIAGRALLDQLSTSGISMSSIRQLRTSDGAKTAQYVAVNDIRRDLVLAMADFSIFERPELESADHWSNIFTTTKPKWAVMDANWSEPITASIIQSAKLHQIPIAFEPVSTAKAARIFNAASKVLSASSVIPNPLINLATPNKMELSAMHKAAQASRLFESEQWWQAIDSFSLSSSGSRDKFVMMTSPRLVDEGLPQQCIHLLPFIPNLVTKLGPEGCLLISVLRQGDDRLTSLEAAPYILSRNHSKDSTIGGIYMRLFPAEQLLEQEQIVSVNGVGDTLLGVLMAGILGSINSGKPIRLEDLIPVAQKAAILTLRSNEAVSPEVKNLRHMITQKY